MASVYSDRKACPRILMTATISVAFVLIGYMLAVIVNGSRVQAGPIVGFAAGWLSAAVSIKWGQHDDESDN